MPEPQKGCILQNLFITGGKLINAGLNFGIGNKDKPIHVSSYKGYSKRIGWISKEFVILWDEEAKRVWLVNGATALLHLVHASQDYNRTDTLERWFLLTPEQMDNSGSAIDVLMNSKNKMIELYQDDDELIEQKTPNRLEQNCFRLKDQIEQVFNYLEKMIDSQVDAARRGGIKLKGRVRKYIEDWDFTDLATEDPPFYPKVSTLQAMGSDWVDIAVAIDAITLFGRGFDYIFQPVEPYQCARWVELPRQRYYLAACASDFKYINHGESWRPCDKYNNQREGNVESTQTKYVRSVNAWNMIQASIPILFKSFGLGSYHIPCSMRPNAQLN